jgi:hypothetical protein
VTAPTRPRRASPDPLRLAGPPPARETSPRPPSPEAAGLVSAPRKKRRPKDIGTTAETAVVRYLQASGFPHAERRAMRGRYDQGDITGTPGVCWEVKARDKDRPISDKQISQWLDETTTETRNADADVGVLVIRRPGKGASNAGAWWAVLNCWEAVGLGMDDFSHTRTPALLDFPVRLLLADAVRLLRVAGYGDPLEES